MNKFDVFFGGGLDRSCGQKIYCTVSSCKTFEKSWLFALCARARIPHRNPHHLSTTRLSKSIFDRIGNFEAAKVLIILIPNILDISTRPLLYLIPIYLLNFTSKSKAITLL